MDLFKSFNLISDEVKAIIEEMKKSFFIEREDDEDELENNNEMNKERYDFDPMTGQPLPQHPTPNNRNFERIMRQLAELTDKIDTLSVDLKKVATSVQNNSIESRAIREELIQLDKLDQMTELKSVIDSQETVIKSQHDASVKYNEDVLYKTQKPLIMEMISIADEIRMIMDSKRKDNSYDLMEALKNLEESVEASLSNNSVRRFRETEYDDVTLNRRRQTVVGRENTSVSDLDNHYMSYSPGYEWTMPYLVVNSEVKLNKIIEENGVPQTFSFVIRPEEVVKLKYTPEIIETVEPAESTSDPTELED